MLTPIGIYLYNVLAMGLSNATDIFETCMRSIVDGLQDDVLVYASDYDVFKSNVVSFLDCCMEHDLHLNPDNIRINVDSVPTLKNSSPSWEVSTILASSFHICPHIGSLSKTCLSTVLLMLNFCGWILILKPLTS